jgi:hypothetical protein
VNQSRHCCIHCVFSPSANYLLDSVHWLFFWHNTSFEDFGRIKFEKFFLNIIFYAVVHFKKALLIPKSKKNSLILLSYTFKCVFKWLGIYSFLNLFCSLVRGSTLIILHFFFIMDIHFPYIINGIFIVSLAVLIRGLVLSIATIIVPLCLPCFNFYHNSV